MKREQRQVLQALEGRAGALLLRRALAPLRTAQRGRELPPSPSAEDRALYATTTPAERARVAILLRGAGFTRAEVERGEQHLQAAGASTETSDDGPADDVTRARARALLRGRT